MKLNRDDILKLAKLSRLKLSEDNVTRYQKELSAILDYVAQLDEVDTSGIKPTYQVTGLTSQDANATREDKITKQLESTKLLKNVPNTQDGQIRVKRMIN